MSQNKTKINEEKDKDNNLDKLLANKAKYVKTFPPF